ncbi:hypothetical protein PYW07_008840 [Mythimna separata]|uniref:ZAD domain-containing protein n=1 Tax=Mythimna separata TaxID=271217 RepID=A0AAD8DM05_MYTSE|nr:hypothetical protein PYW07_008840 [Mythimna separata]
MAKKKVKSKAKQPVKPFIPKSISSEVIAEACSSVPPPVFMKVCRLCESKDGPFLNIFDADKVTARKIDELMPFGIAENDDLPHKICFRCSAKLEELYEFVLKCIKTQENLRTAVGKTGPFITKTRTRKAWEDKLNKTNMSNDDICDALIKKAMEGIKDIPLKSLPKEEEAPPPAKRVTRRNDPKQIKKEPSDDDNDELNLKEVKLNQQKNEAKVFSTKTTRSSNNSDTSKTSNKISNVEPPQNSINKNNQDEKKPSENKAKSNSLINSLSFDYTDAKSSSDNKVEINETVDTKPFNIMDYISMIKVNGVGVLFQCKLCNRNFLKKEVVESHNCAKNGIPKIMIPKSEPAPEPPKVSTVKYITIEGSAKKPNSWKSYKFDNDKNSVNENKSDKVNTDSAKNIDDSLKTDVQKQEHSNESASPVKPKPKAGPASKTRRSQNNPDQGSSQNSSDSQESQANSQSPSVHIPSAPNLNGRFKLVPGPNNIFTLVEDTAAAVTENQKTPKKRKLEAEVEKPKDRKKDSHEKSKSPEVIETENQAQPYPVGLFQTVAHSTRLYDPPVSAPPTFTTPAMKKQSYTIVPTGNPSKLLISTKAIATPAEVPKKRQRKAKPEVREEFETKEPFRVTLEDVAQPQDTGFFTFINVDPLLQPSYVLPTDNIIQESQISTSTATVNTTAECSKESKDKDKYSCNMCGDSFSREKKLLSHIQSHYTKMDEEDQQRAEKTTKKKGRKS